MNQFDKLFGGKLNDEQAFGGQKRSWTQLNHDLNAFEVGRSVTAKSLALWKAVSIIAILSSIALLWERQHLVRENELLKVSPSEPQKSTLAKPDVASLPENFITEPATGIPAVSSTATPPGTSNAMLHANPMPHPALPYPVPAVEIAQNRTETPGDDAPVSTDSQVLPLAFYQILDGKKPATEIDTLIVAAQSNLTVEDSILQKDISTPDSVQQKTMVASASVIDPVHIRDKRWQVGVRLSLGQPIPKEKGVSMVKSQGLALAFRVWKNFSLTASADFMQFDVQTDSIPRHYCAIKLPPPGPGHHYFDLENVSSNQIMQQYNLGLRYNLKLTGPWRLSVNAAHTWVHQPSRFASLRFEEMQPHGGGPGWHPDNEYLTIQSFKTWTSSIVRLGLGVQYETLRWSFGVNGDYAQKLNDRKPSFDTAYASAEIMYKF